MSTTREMVQDFKANPESPPDQVKTMTVRQFEATDPDDSVSPLREIAPKDVPVTYCWRVDVASVTYWISQADDTKLMVALKPAAEDEEPGPVVGMRAKVRPDGKTLAYGPVELRAMPWQRLQALVGTLISE